MMSTLLYGTPAIERVHPLPERNATRDFYGAHSGRSTPRVTREIGVKLLAELKVGSLVDQIWLHLKERIKGLMAYQHPLLCWCMTRRALWRLPDIAAKGFLEPLQWQMPGLPYRKSQFHVSGVFIASRSVGMALKGYRSFAIDKTRCPSNQMRSVHTHQYSTK